MVNGWWTPSGLIPQYYTGKPYHIGRLCALLEPLPDSYVNNPHFLYEWIDLKKHVGKILIEVDVDEGDESIFVADRAHIIGHSAVDQGKIPPKYIHQTRWEADEAFYQNRVSLREYLQEIQATKDFFLLPEVNLTTRVPKERLGIPHYQPLLQEELEGMDNDQRSKEITQLLKIPQMRPWIEDHLSRNNSVDGSARGKEIL